MLRRSVLLLLCCAAVSAVEHPFILWTPEEAVAIRERIATDPDAQAQLEHMRSSSMSKANKTVWNLFRYVVLEEEMAGKIERAALLDFIGRKPEPMTWDVDLDTLEWNEGMPSSGDSHMRDEQTLNTLRYDCLYHMLDAEQRAGVEASLRSYIDFHLAGHKPHHPAFKYNRTSWLPNMHWPRTIGTHLMAVALGDEELIAAMFASQGGWKWFFDEYIADERFYMEEFGKYYSNIGTMLMYCEALEKLDLGRYGYGYTGERGATMRKYLGMLPAIGLPRLEAPEGGMPRYPVVTMGDAGDLHCIVKGRGFRNRKGKPDRDTPFWKGSRMNGPLPKLRIPGWYEIGHKRWPEDGYDYFLAQMRDPGQDRYLPSLYWNLEPIDPATVEPPPAPSVVSDQRGFALLRAEQGPAYWEGPAPAVSQQFATYYVHYVHDCFSILQFVANNRLLYNKMGRPEGRKGYAGGDDWKDHVRGHCGVVVDGLKAEPVDDGNSGSPSQRIRQDLRGPARFSAVQAAGVYPDVDQERALVLTDAYLLDVFSLVSERERTYDWQVLAYASTVDRGGDRWTAIADWQGREARRAHLQQSRVFAPGSEPWQVSLLQEDRGEPRGVGVRVHMLGAPGTMVLDSLPPGVNDPATSLLVSRQAQRTVFTALHEPFAGGPEAVRISEFSRIVEDDRVLAVRIRGEGIDDRVIVAYGPDIEEARQVAAGDEVYTVTGFALVRIAPETIRVQGDVQALALPVTGEPRLLINGDGQAATIADGVLRFDSDS
ncbi:MAG: hypothetical protein ACOCZK_08020 [Planctomycetota bacterium]